MMYLDLGELPTLFEGSRLWANERAAVASFRRSDHFGDPATPLDESIRGLVEARTGRRPDGPVRLLTHLRYFGYVFNPVSFYFCFDAAGGRPAAIVAEINNTPWGERHCYVLDARHSAGGASRLRFGLTKEFHISPFMDMGLRYDWRFTPPGPRLSVHMENYDGPRKLFDATLVMRRREATRGALARALIRYPLMTARVVGAIYWQALRLRLKGAPFYAHPKHRAMQTEARPA